MKKIKGMNEAGFSLVELLIVVAIIAILAAVLLPNILNARKRSYDAAAQTYMTNVGKWVAAADAAKNGLTPGSTINCLTGLTAAATGEPAKLVTEGATNAPAQSVRACTITVDATTSRVSITVTSQGNRSYTMVY